MKATVSLESHTLSFTHLGGFLRLTLSRIPKDAATLQFEASDVTLSGDFAVSNGKISAASGTKTTLSCNVSESATSKVYTLIVPETSFASGFSIKILNGSSEELYTKSTSKPISVGRATIKPMAQLTVPISIYVRNNGTNWTEFMAYYSSGTYTTSTWGTNEISDFSTTYTHNGKSYYRFTLPTSETASSTCLIVFHDSANDAVGRVHLNGLTLGGDRYYTVSGDGEDRMYVKCYKTSWGSPLYFYLYDHIDNNEDPMGGWPGTSSANTLRIDLEHHHADFVYWAFPEDEKGGEYDYGIIINDGTNQTAGEWANKIRVPAAGYDIVAYVSDGGSYGQVGYGKVATYTLD